MSPKRDWFTIAEAADRLAIPVQTFYNWVHDRRVKTDLAGRATYLIHESEIEALRQNGNRPIDRRYTRPRAAT